MTVAAKNIWGHRIVEEWVETHTDCVHWWTRDVGEYSYIRIQKCGDGTYHLWVTNVRPGCRYRDIGNIDTLEAAKHIGDLLAAHSMELGGIRKPTPRISPDSVSAFA